jgi:hypothetical protein
MLGKRISVILLFVLILGILISHGANYENPSVAFAAGSGAQPVAQVPINITNTQIVALPSPFQLMIQVNSTEYAAYEAADLSNVAFTYSNGTVIPSWLESGNSNSSTDTVYWLKVGSIPARSSMTVFMDFYPVADNVFNNMTTGEAPQLSPSYGEYDDGAHVFIEYGDFNSSLSGWEANIYAGSFLPTPSFNGVEMLNGNGNEGTYLASPTTLPQIPIEVEEGWDYSGSADAHAISMFGVSPFGPSTALISPGEGGHLPVLNQSTSAIFDYYSSFTHLREFITNSLVSSSSFTGGGSFSVVSFLTVNRTWASAGYKITDASLEDFGSVLVPTAVSGPIPNPFNNRALIISSGDGGSSSYQYVRWIIGRAFPPNGVAPSVTIGKVEAVSEFPSYFVLPLFMIATLVAALVLKKKRIPVEDNSVPILEKRGG